jgi:hypothetical protein
MVDMMMLYPAADPTSSRSSLAKTELLNGFPQRSAAHTIQSGGALRRVSIEAWRREPTQKEYHTGSRAAGRESAKRQCVVLEKTLKEMNALRETTRTSSDEQLAGKEKWAA